MTKQIFLEQFIPQMDSIDKVYEFFSRLGYQVLSPNYKGKEAYDLREKENQLIEEIYTIANYSKQFQAFLIKLKEPSHEVIRSLPDLFLREVHYPFLVFTPDYRNYTFTFVEKIREDVGVFKKKIVRLNLDRENAYYTDKQILSEIALEEEKSPAEIYSILKEAFSVEKVTKQFFEDYKRLFFDIRQNFFEQEKELRLAHNFTQQLLNRLMFLYFVAKKRWLGEDPKFLWHFWENYKKTNQQKDSFYSNWLSVLFFEAFNKRFARRDYFSGKINADLVVAPYLNGGLFRENRLDKTGLKVSDSLFESIFTFFEKYNFTIREEMPFEEEVAVDPEMIGKVYETLVNLSETSDERGDIGIFYTPRVEIDFMCRRSLVEYFSKNTTNPNVSKSSIYQFIFSKTEDERKKAEVEFTKLNLWPEIEDLLDDFSIVDPACGSGSFLVGMLNIIAGLYKSAYKNLGRPIDDFEIKKQIIGRSLYGVDVMDWAVHVAELRLWLQLIVESELPASEIQMKPLLPNLTFKVKQGDSLVEEIGGINLSLRQDKTLSPTIKRKITQLKQEKLKFYNNNPSRKFKTESLLLHEELNIFQALLDEKIHNLHNQLVNLRNALHTLKEQGRLITPNELQVREQEKMELYDKNALRKEIEKLEKEEEKLKDIRINLNLKTKPFVWDIDFVEIFSAPEEAGFDVVIGNPPYVRQEKIADPQLPKEEITNENKREYKEKLIRSVQARFPVIQTLSKRSDLYIYFYFHGLALLNKKGTFCFITSNSWLDVDYGKDLQYFLLRYVPIEAIYDNLAKRSFTQANINTIIALFDTPDLKNQDTNLSNIAKFVMFKKPFEEVIKIKNLLDIEKSEKITSNENFRVYPIKQEKLLEEGMEYKSEEQKKLGAGEYIGNKWGDKYLRAPNIFFRILEKNKFIKLGDISLKTQRNTLQGFDKPIVLEENYSKHNNYPYLYSVKDAGSIKIKLSNLSKSLKREGGDVEYLIPDIISNRFWGERMFFIEGGNFLVSDTFFVVKLKKEYKKDICLALLNSTASLFIGEVIGRKGLGGGLLTIYGPELKMLRLLDPKILDKNTTKKLLDIFDKISRRKINPIFEECGINPRKPIRDQKPNPLPDRKTLDDIIFDILGLTSEERKEVYWSVCELVKNRLQKAKSV